MQPQFQLICYTKFGTAYRCGLYWTWIEANESGNRHMGNDYIRFEVIGE